MFCSNCKDRLECEKQKFLKARVCKKVENYLQRKTPDRLYCDKTIKRHETPTEDIAIDYILRNRKGKINPKKIDQNE